MTYGKTTTYHYPLQLIEQKFIQKLHYKKKKKYYFVYKTALFTIISFLLVIKSN